MTSARPAAGERLQQVLKLETPLQLVGTINAYTALLAQKAGFRAIYLSGAGVANASYGLPDLGMTTRDEVLEDVRRITGVVDLPLLVDIDTGWGGYFNIARSIKEMTRAGAAGVHIEDQIQTKRCGHRPKKSVVSADEMVDRIQCAVDAKTESSFIIMARTDALATEGLEATLARCQQYVNAGADMIFFEGARSLSDYQALTKICQKPILANMTEFGLTPLLTKEELSAAGVRLILYPLSAFRAMNAAALNVYKTIRQTGTQKNLLEQMQTRDELYDILNYHAYEQQLDEFTEGNIHE